VQKTEQLIREYIRFSGSVLEKNYNNIVPKMRKRPRAPVTQ